MNNVPLAVVCAIMIIILAIIVIITFWGMFFCELKSKFGLIVAIGITLTCIKSYHN